MDNLEIFCINTAPESYIYHSVKLQCNYSSGPSETPSETRLDWVVFYLSAAVFGIISSFNFSFFSFSIIYQWFVSFSHVRGAPRVSPLRTAEGLLKQGPLQIWRLCLENKIIKNVFPANTKISLLKMEKLKFLANHELYDLFLKCRFVPFYLMAAFSEQEFKHIVIFLFFSLFSISY